jgi:hypothetical protein
MVAGLRSPRRTVLLAAVWAFLVACLAAGASPLGFAPFQAYRANADSQSAAIANVIGDRRPEVLLTDPSRLLVFRRRADSSLRAPVVYRTAGSSGSTWVAGLAVADFSRDGRLDLAVATKVGVQLFRARQGRLMPPRTIRLPFRAMTVAASDLNSDGRPDLAVSGQTEPGVTYKFYVLWNRRGGWRPQKLDDAWFTAIRFADINADRKLDIVPLPWGSSETPTLRFYLGDGRGRFRRSDVRVADNAHDAPAGLAARDVTSDGRADLVFGNGRNRPRSHLAVMAGTASGRLATAKLYPSYDIPQAVAIADLNGDRRNDVVVLHGGWKKLGLYYQRADGALGPEQLLDIPYSTHYNPNAVTIGRIDSGPRPDIAIADNGYTQGLTILLQR